MRIILNFFLLTMVVIMGLAAYSILNTYVSIKYEIEPLGKTSAMQEKAELYQSLIMSYWIIICLGILVVVLTLDKLKNRKAEQR